MLGILGGLGRALLPLAAKKLASIPIAQQAFKTISPILSTIMPTIG